MRLSINDRFHVRQVEFFNRFRLDLRYDALASPFNFEFYFDPLNEDHRELACVSHYHEAILDHEGERMLTGYILSQNFTDSSIKSLSQLAGYSLPGLLEDSSIPQDLYPLQYNGLSLRSIAQRLLSRFNLKMIVDPLVSSDMDIVYPETTASEGQTVKAYLSELATQRNIVISHNEFGNVVFTRANTTQEPFVYFDGNTPGVTFRLNFNGQGIHSHITVMKQADVDGGNASQTTIRNPYVPVRAVYRPITIVQTSGDTSTDKAARAALASELKNITLTINIDRWILNGKLIKPNSIISVKNPECFLFKPTRWFVESVTYSGDADKLTAELKCVLPEVYNGQMPKNIFVDVHENFPRL